MNKLVNALHWLDIVILRNGSAYRKMLLRNGFFTANEMSDQEVLDYIWR